MFDKGLNLKQYDTANYIAISGICPVKGSPIDNGEEGTLQYIIGYVSRNREYMEIDEKGNRSFNWVKHGNPCLLPKCRYFASISPDEILEQLSIIFKPFEDDN